MGDLHVDERHRAVEPHDGAVVEPGLLAGAQVDPRLGQPALVDEPRIEREQRLRPPGVQAGVAAVDVHMATAGSFSAGKLDDSSVPCSCSVGANRPWMAI